jgi:hypothetical protein
VLRFAPLHCAGRSASVLAHEHKLGFLPVAEMDAGHRLLRNASAPAEDMPSGQSKSRFAAAFVMLTLRMRIPNLDRI